MEGKNVITGGLALIVGLLGGYALSPSGPDLSDIENVLGARIDAVAAQGGEGVSAITETVQTLDTRLDELAARLATLDERIGEAAGAGANEAASRLDALESRLGETSQDVRAALGEMAANQKSMLDAALAELSARPAVPTTPETSAASAPPADDQAADAQSAPPEGLTAGHTAILSDGAIRVFVSRVDNAAKAARLSINGALTELTEGHSIAYRPDGDYCRVTLDGVDRGHARVSSACGDELPAPVGQTPGSTETLGDGAARVFLSSVSNDDSSARIAVNGVDLLHVDAGGTVPVGDTGCRIAVEQIDRGHVTFSFNC